MTMETAQIGRRTCDRYFAVYYRILCAYIYYSRKQSMPSVPAVNVDYERRDNG